MARGGRRKGTPGQSYPNRSDLTPAGGSQPVRTATGQAYGVAGQQAAAQRAIPLPQATGVPGPPGAPTPQGPMPGELPPLTAPTQRPGEPLTAGMPTGPGPGPEILAPPDPLVKAAAILNALGTTADPDTHALRMWVNATVSNGGAA